MILPSKSPKKVGLKTDDCVSGNSKGQYKGTSLQVPSAPVSIYHPGPEPSSFLDPGR